MEETGNKIGLSKEEIESVLVNGILVKKDGSFVKPQGRPSLFWHPSLERFAIAYGTDASNAGFVLVADYGRLWKEDNGKA